MLSHPGFVIDVIRDAAKAAAATIMSASDAPVGSSPPPAGDRIPNLRSRFTLLPQPQSRT
jgi:hypothetical protein